MKLIHPVVLAVSIALAGPVFGQQGGAETIVFSIPRTRLQDALSQWSKVTGQQIFSEAAPVSNLTANPVVGSYTSMDALRLLLENTDLTFDQVSDQMVVIKARPPATVKTSLPLTRLAVQLPSEQTTQADAASRVTQSSERGSPPPARSDASIETVMVTAQKRAERLIDVPISIVALGGDELQNRRIESVDELALAVPGLSIQSSGGFQRRIMLRGVSNTVGNSSLVGIYVDEASATSASPVTQLDLRAYDLERVEVLRGPQGTIYGEGSAGGTIRFITNAPQLSEFSVKGDVAALFIDDGEPGGRVEGMINVPVISNELAIRIAGVVDHQGGWMDQPAAGKDGFNDQELTNVRAKALWRPVEQFSVDAMAIIHRNEAAPNVGENADGDYVQVFNLTTTPSVEDDYELYNVTMNYDFAGMRLLSTTTQINQDKLIRNQGFRFQLTPPGTPTSDSHFLSDTRGGEILTQELRLISAGAGPWKWTFGGFYQDSLSERDLFQYFGATGAPGTALPALLRSRTELTADSWAVFGDASYEFTERLTVGTGLRYFETDQEFRSGATLASFQQGKFDALNPRVYAQFKLNERANVYASAAKGFRSGGFNNLAVQPPYEPESVWTYELGLKGAVAGGDLTGEVAIFYTDYSDYQIFGFLPQNPTAGNITSNAGDAEIRGIEVSVAWRPADQWLLSLNGNYVDAEFVEINATTSSYAVGDPLDLFPEYGFTVSAQHDFTLMGRDGLARVDYNEQGKMTYRNRRTGPWLFDESDVINMLNLKVSMQWSEAWSVGVFAQNLLDDRGFTDPFGIDENAARARPRTFGIEFGVDF